MKKIKLAVIAAFMPLMAQASDITVISTSSRNSPTTTVAMTLQENLAGSKFYQADSCLDGVKKFQDTKDSVLVYGTSLAFASVAKGQICKPQITEKNIVFYGEQFFKICTKKGSGKNFRSANATFGIPSVMQPGPIVADINAQNGTSIKALPFSGSKDVLLQIMSGDLDLGLLGASAAQKQESSGAIECVASTNPVDQNYIGKQLKMKIPDLRIPVTVLVNGVDSADQRARVKSALESKGFVGLLDQGNYVARTTTSDKALLDRVEVWIDRYIKSYVAK
jgi:hypothetical protein